jgi:hypothetical protein
MWQTHGAETLGLAADRRLELDQLNCDFTAPQFIGASVGGMDGGHAIYSRSQCTGGKENTRRCWVGEIFWADRLRRSRRERSFEMIDRLDGLVDGQLLRGVRMPRRRLSSSVTSTTSLPAIA